MDDVFCTAPNELVGQMYMHVHVFERKRKGCTFSSIKTVLIDKEKGLKTNTFQCVPWDFMDFCQ